MCSIHQYHYHGGSLHAPGLGNRKRGVIRGWWSAYLIAMSSTGVKLCDPHQYLNWFSHLEHFCMFFRNPPVLGPSYLHFLCHTWYTLSSLVIVSTASRYLAMSVRFLPFCTGSDIIHATMLTDRATAAVCIVFHNLINNVAAISI